jgi:methylmalonyl-CoA mutase cobalamin-binding subunit
MVLYGEFVFVVHDKHLPCVKKTFFIETLGLQSTVPVEPLSVNIYLTFSTCYAKYVTLVREGAFVRTAVIILGHGSRNTGADEAIRKIIDGVKQTGSFAVVEHAFLQYVPPTPQEVIERCVGKDVDRVVIVPFFLQAGAHVTRDIPELIERVRKQHPDIEIVVTDYVGAHPLMAKVVEELAVKRIAD